MMNNKMTRENQEMENKMKHYPAISLQREANLLLGNEDMFGIYQIAENSPARDYQFMGMNYIERKGYDLQRSDYNLVYTGELWDGDSLDSIYERFNVNHPADYKGHSLSVSDIVVLNENGMVKAYFVDSISFRELHNFLKLEEMLQDEIAYQIDNRYLAIQTVDEGYDYTFYDEKYRELDRGVYDAPDVPMEKVVEILLENENLVVIDKVMIDYDELQEKVEQAQNEYFTNIKVDYQRIPVISEHREPEISLNGMSRSEIEETVWAMAQAEIIDNDLDATIQAVRVYGSRTRDGLYKTNSDLDVVIAYEGEIREDDFFNILNNVGYRIGNMKLDMNPIRPDKSGTIEEFLDKSEKYLDEKVEEFKQRGEYKPLAKVEELEESNYNMIDNVLNNMPPKKQPSIGFYAAAVEEFHSMGAYEESTDIHYIANKYREYLESPESLYGNGELGIIYHDPDNRLFDGSEVGLIVGKTIHGEYLKNVPFLAEKEIVHDALKQIRECFPDFRYIPAKDIVDILYPENMTTEQLATALAEIAEAYDPYEYRDAVDSDEDVVETIIMDLKIGGAHQYISYLKDIVEDECEYSQKAGVLIERLKAYEIDGMKDMEPIVHVDFCEKAEFVEKKYQTLEELDKKVKELDAQLSADQDEKTGQAKKMVMMYFTVYYPGDHKVEKMKGKACIGDGCGGIVGYLKTDLEMKLMDESWINYQKGKGEEAYSEYLADMTNLQKSVFPYLQQFVALEEQHQITSKEPVVVDQDTAKKKNGVKREQNVNEDRLSIHERLARNKEKIQMQSVRQGKDRKIELV